MVKPFQVFTLTMPLQTLVIFLRFDPTTALERLHWCLQHV